MNESIKSNKKIIAVWGNNGAGKSTFVTQTSILLAKNTNLKILALDFDTLSPALDHYFGVSKQPDNISYKVDNKDDEIYNTSLNYAYDAIERGIFDANVLREIVIKYPKCDNLHVLSGNHLINMFENFNSNHFINIIEIAKKIYDVLIIDTSSVIFVDSTYISLKYADKIYTLTEADYTSLRHINKTISYLNSLISKEKFEIIVNKYTSNHLDKTTVKQILQDYKFSQLIKYNTQYIKSKVNKKPFIVSCNKKDKRPYLEIVNNI